ncbi:NUDIX hydrolase [Consotaella salsifontis]|uniref:ADP-ribose pyrophosphatase YjhB, NUDIX family n=1 Tax=Consotaella salsifontis TaxID=1365950 RepID=A0A1T4SZ70_9HYPH|nr:NUDIX hydrolase [Consotaella salsifontis]SKA33526.1 ADP-ribose pyrophosphatase YjhB, NUDIX family [Consotaella salsifontis]
MSNVEPDWLKWTRELQAIAQSGLAYVKDPYDKERYEMLRALASRVMSSHTGVPAERIEQLFTGEEGYATPKVDVRGATFDAEGRILMVREVMDGGRWTLPGGWADVNLTAAENTVKEVFEESGYEAEVTKLAAVWDRTRQGHPSKAFSCCKFFFVCRLLGGSPSASLETSEVGWFAEDAIPDDLSLGRVLPGQIARMFAHWRNPDLPTDYD